MRWTAAAGWWPPQSDKHDGHCVTAPALPMPEASCQVPWLDCLCGRSPYFFTIVPSAGATLNAVLLFINSCGALNKMSGFYVKAAFASGGHVKTHWRDWKSERWARGHFLPPSCSACVAALQWQRCSTGTPLSAASMWRPQPPQLGLPHEAHVCW